MATNSARMCMLQKPEDDPRMEDAEIFPSNGIFTFVELELYKQRKGKKTRT
jgi:hypothetical protein